MISRAQAHMIATAASRSEDKHLRLAERLWNALPEDIKVWGENNNLNFSRMEDLLALDLFFRNYVEEI